MITLTDTQREKLTKLWYIYGNYGKKCTACNHGYIQGFLEHGEDRKDFYLQAIENMKERFSEDEISKRAITEECINEVENILRND